VGVMGDTRNGGGDRGFLLKKIWGGGMKGASGWGKEPKRGGPFTTLPIHRQNRSGRKLLGATPRFGRTLLLVYGRSKKGVRGVQGGKLKVLAEKGLSSRIAKKNLVIW